MIGISSGIRMLALGGFISIAAGGYWYYTKSQAQINGLQNQVAQSDAAIQIQSQFIDKQTQVIDDINNNMILLQEVQLSLAEDARASAAEVTELKSKFNTTSGGKDRDLGVIASAKPTLISKIVNKATGKMGEEIEELTAIEPVIESEEALPNE
jgi:hypothetical protein|tara:strand:+ start:355 stop:816 length:462 start_codon:yes stop_codon:yes gene_type:complete